MEQKGKTAKFKTAAKNNVKGVDEASGWKQPLRRHKNPTTGEVDFVTILVRVLSGDSEHDFQARFSSTTLTPEIVCEAIAEKEQLDPAEATLFSLWVISKDLELQVRKTDDIFGLMVFWNNWVLKYTHFPEAQNPQHHVNHNWFVYRREAAVTLGDEKNLAGVRARTLLFGEVFEFKQAKRNILTNRYVCSQLEAATIAGMQLQIAYGDHDQERFKTGYLSNGERLSQLLPVGMPERIRASQWEEIITVQYKTFIGLDVDQVRSTFLDFIRPMPCYGCSFFPACGELPPSGFFEYRTQNWFIGVGPNGVVVMDFDILKYVQILPWKDLTWTPGADQLVFQTFKNGRPKEIYLITPQSYLISNLCEVMKYKWAKDHGILPQLKNKIVNPLHIMKTTTTDHLRKHEPIKDKSPTANKLMASFDSLGKKMKGKLKESIGEKSSQEGFHSEESQFLYGDKLDNIMVDTTLPQNYSVAGDTIIGSDAYNAKKNETRKQNRQKGLPMKTPTSQETPNDKTHTQSLNVLKSDQKSNNRKSTALLAQLSENLIEKNSANQENKPTAQPVTQIAVTNTYRTTPLNSRRGRPILNADLGQQSNTELDLLESIDAVDSSKTPIKISPSNRNRLRSDGRNAYDVSAAEAELLATLDDADQNLPISPSKRTPVNAFKVKVESAKTSEPQSHILDYYDSATPSPRQKIVPANSHSPSGNSPLMKAQSNRELKSFGSFAKQQPKEKFSVKGSGGIKQRSSAIFHMDSHIGGLAPVVIIDKRMSIIKEPNGEDEVPP